MGYLMVQILVFLALAAAVGFAAGWTLRGRRAAAAPGAGGAPPAPPGPATARESARRAPAEPDGGRAGAAASGDDLKRISGIGPQLEAGLNALGVIRLEQIAQWSAEQAAAMDAKLDARGRVQRDDWVGQARRLVSLG